jgi:hypothetical protein
MAPNATGRAISAVTQYLARGRRGGIPMSEVDVGFGVDD